MESMDMYQSVSKEMNMPQGQDMPMPMPNNGTNNNNMMMQSMKMSFYWGKHAIVLFSGWPNNSVGMYILAILFVFFLAMVAEVLSNQPPITIGRETSAIKGAMAQAGVYIFRISFLYLVMLAVMSFNVGIFIAAVAGHTLGFFIARSRALAINNREDPKV